MPETIGEAFVAIRPDTAGFGPEVQSGVTGSLTKLGGALAGLFATSKIKDFFATTIDEATDAAKVSAQTEAVLRSTSGAAGVTAKEIDNLASSLSNKVGVDDEVIARGENMLLTFTNIRKESGRGNDIFKLATKATLDLAAGMAAATGGEVDLAGASIQVGKALNDPIQGVTALRRVGVQLSDAQEEQVKAFVATNNIMGAQKIILAELNKEFGGSAAAQATLAQKAQVAWANLKETLGTALLPVVKALADAFVPLLKYLAEHKTLAIALAAVIGGALVAAFVAWAASAIAATAATLAALAPILAITAAVLAVAAAIVFVWTHWDQIWTWIKDHPAYAVILAILAAPVAAFVLIVGGLKWLYENWSNIWDAIERSATDAVDGIVNAFNGVVDFFGNLPNAILGAFKSAWNAIASAINHAIPNQIGFDTPFGFFGIDLPNNPIPLLHSGGIFHAPPGQTEGLAVLQEGERVIANNGGGGDTINITVQSTTDDPVWLAMEIARNRRLAQFAMSS